MDWKHLLAYITGTVDQELLLRNEYLVTENRILRHQLTGRVQLTDGERKTLAVIGQKLAKQALKEVATIVKPDIILAWHRRLVAQKFDGSQQRKRPGCPPIDQALEANRIIKGKAMCCFFLPSARLQNVQARYGVVNVWVDCCSSTTEKRHEVCGTAGRVKTVMGRDAEEATDRDEGRWAWT